MKVIIAGGRDFNNYALLKENCDWYLSKLDKSKLEIVHGAASGADSLADRYADEHGIKKKVFPADWNTHGRAAGPIRNREMALYADALIAFPGGRGTRNMIAEARKRGLKVRVVEIPEEES